MKIWAVELSCRKRETKVRNLISQRSHAANPLQLGWPMALPSPEDYGKDNTKPVPVNPDVERVRRAHLNDLENIPIFMIVALLYGLSGEPVARGIWCLRIFTGARFLHTIAYLNGISVPRALGFLSGSVCTAVLGFSVLYSAVKTGVF